MAEQDIAQATTIVDRNILSTPADPIHIDIHIYILHHKFIKSAVQPVRKKSRTAAHFASNGTNGPGCTGGRSQACCRSSGSSTDSNPLLVYWQS
jgi:hypothetical protein